VDREALRRLLRQVRSGRVAVEEALERLRQGPVEELGFATLDLHRAVRKGFPEVVYGEGKTPEQIAAIVARLNAAGQTVLVTRVGPEVHELAAATHPRVEYHPLGRCLVLRAGPRRAGRPGVVILTAGTTDIPVAEEAAVTAEAMGCAVERIYDVGVAGLHRLMAHSRALLGARVIVAVAGMEGALPSVVAGLVDCPVLGVPTSTGYGAGARGEAALLAMLNSCASGISVVNIDNGFGAGYVAALINRQSMSMRGRGRRRTQGEFR
jgi:pyridinium-3,5-biscarboxylic acid mononucleotide synthase